MRISRAIFTNDAKSAVAYPYIWQWDFGRIIKIYGLDLPEEFDAHLYEDGSKEALVLVGTEDSVGIPDAFLESGRNLTLYLYLHEQEDDGETVRTIHIPVHERAKPDEKTDQGSNHVEGEHRKYINLAASALSAYEYWETEETMDSASYVIAYANLPVIHAVSELPFEDEILDEQSWVPNAKPLGETVVVMQDSVFNFEDEFFDDITFVTTVYGGAEVRSNGDSVFDATAFMDEPDPEIRFETSLEVQIQSEDG